MLFRSEAPAEVQLQMRAEILDGMFNGTTDAMEGGMAFMQKRKPAFTGA